MDFFDKIGKKASDAYKATADKTGKIAREAKLKMKITENKSKIKSLYEEIGKKVYENHVREEDTNFRDFINESCSKIDELSNEIEEARKEILVLNNKKMCKKCFAEIETGAMFCPKCGERQTEEKTVLEKAEEKLEEAEIPPENQKEAEIVKEELEQKNNQE